MTGYTEGLTLDRRLRFAHQLVGDDPVPPVPSGSQKGAAEFRQLRLLDLDPSGQGFSRFPAVVRAKQRHREDHVSLHVAALARAEERVVNALARPHGRAVEVAEAVLGQSHGELVIGEIAVLGREFGLERVRSLLLEDGRFFEGGGTKETYFPETFAGDAA